MPNISFETLDEFAFRRLSSLLAKIDPKAGLAPIDFSIGEPKHPPPACLSEIVGDHANLWNRYPPPNGTPEYRRAAGDWLQRRYKLAPGFIDPDHNILPLAGTKEGLFLLPSTIAKRANDGRQLALMPDPVYAVYVGAAVAAGIEPYPLRATRATGFLPDLAALTTDQLQRASMLTICTPANPQGTIASSGYIEHALGLAQRHDFLLVLDECYCEIYEGTPPAGGLQVAQESGLGYRNLVVMHSLSKRSNAAGLRAGFIAGDADVIARFAQIRAYGAAVQPLPLMHAATALWRDEVHVRENRDAYRRKMQIARRLIGDRYGFYKPPGGFFLWLDVGHSIDIAKRLWHEAALRTLPGAYLTSGEDEAGEIGGRYIRLALVHDEETIETGLGRLIEVLGS